MNHCRCAVCWAPFDKPLELLDHWLAEHKPRPATATPKVPAPFRPRPLAAPCIDCGTRGGTAFGMRNGAPWRSEHGRCRACWKLWRGHRYPELTGD